MINNNNKIMIDSFVQCDSSGNFYVKSCPAGLKWNDNEKICDWPENSTCSKTPTTTTIGIDYGD